MSYSFSVRAAPIDEFSRRAQMAMTEAAIEGEEQQALARDSVEYATHMVQNGRFGSDWVAAEFSGSANEGHVSAIGQPPTTASFAVWQAASR